MTHELRSPLAAIVSIVRMLKVGAINEQLARDIGTVERLALQALRTVEENIAALRGERPEVKGSPAPVCMKSLAHDIELLSIWVAQQGGGRATVSFSTMPSVIYFDEQKFRQIAVNLLTNAARFCKNGLIDVSVALEYVEGWHQLCLVVRDSGRGMSPLEQHRFVEARQKAPDSEGLGLGLMIVRQLVHELWGRCQLWSEPGKGTEVQVRIPVQCSVQGVHHGIVPLDSGNGFAFVDAPTAMASTSPRVQLLAFDLERMDLNVARNYVQLGQLTCIEQWLSACLDLPGLALDTQKFLREVAMALACVDLSRIAVLLDGAAE